MIYKFGDVQLDTELFSVTREGQPVSVEPKVFDLLVFLIRNRDRLISRDQLFDELWPDRVVSENVLSNDIKLARAAIGDDGQQQRFIRTLRGRGYQFVGDVEEVVSTTGPTADASNGTPSTGAAHALPGEGSRGKGNAISNPPRKLVGAVVLIAAVFAVVWLNSSTEPAIESTGDSSSGTSVESPVNLRPKTIAILPFENRSNLEEDAFFVDGFHDDLISQVSRIRDLTTISRTSVMTYRESDKSIRTIGGELGSAIIIEGGVQRAGDQIRINVQMIDVAKDEHLWAETYTRALSAESVFAIQTEIALEVASQLKAVMSPREQREISRMPTQNLAALEAYLQGGHFFHRFSAEDMDFAIEYFRRAVELDPDFAEAHAALGGALLQKIYFGGLPPDRQIAMAEPIIARALELAPELGMSHSALAVLEEARGDYGATNAAYEKAVELSPNDVGLLRGFAYFKSARLGQHQQALELVDRAELLDPKSPQNVEEQALRGHILGLLGRYQESLAAYRVAITSPRQRATAYSGLGLLLHEKLYQQDQAVKALRQFRFLDPNATQIFLNLGTAYEELGLVDEAARSYELFLEADQVGPLVNIARIRLHYVRGEQDQVERAFAEFEEDYGGKFLWIDTLLSGFHLQQGDPSRVIDRVKERYPRLAVADPDVVSDPEMFNLAMIYATALHLMGKEEQAAPLTDVILDILPSKSRHRWDGIQTSDTWLHMAMGNEEQAIQSLREWRAIGARVDLTKHRMVPSSLFDHPEFQVINNEVLEELAEQRANLARMEAAGELAPIPQ
ncbi:MAG: winged helix-turn-helix domain-containing protein [Woeseiaceae bacterium]|nr:winged helix-turn-helix domain-containing protein [Woeseiaceae bacterium]